VIHLGSEEAEEKISEARRRFPARRCSMIASSTFPGDAIVGRAAISHLGMRRLHRILWVSHTETAIQFVHSARLHRASESSMRRRITFGLRHASRVRLCIMKGRPVGKYARRARGARHSPDRAEVTARFQEQAQRGAQGVLIPREPYAYRRAPNKALQRRAARSAG